MFLLPVIGNSAVGMADTHRASRRRSRRRSRSGRRSAEHAGDHDRDERAGQGECGSDSFRFPSPHLLDILSMKNAHALASRNAGAALNVILA